MFFGRWEVVDEKRHVIARLVRPSLSLLQPSFIWQYASDIVEVDGFDLDIREESVLIEEHRASSVVSYVEPICKNVMFDIFNRFLQGDDMPFPCNSFADCDLFSTSRSWIPVVVAEPFLYG